MSSVPLPTLNGERVSDEVERAIPSGFVKPFNLVVLMWGREGSKDIDSWLPAFRKLELERNGESFVFLMNDARNALMRFAIRTGTRMAIKDEKAKSRSYMCFEDNATVAAALGIEKIDVNVLNVFLTNQQGKILTRFDGPGSDARETEILQITQS